MDITTREYKTLEEAYNYLNKKLFKSELPDCIITLQRKAHSRGYFHAQKFSGRTNKKRVDEIAMNPDTFTQRTDKEILSTLAHEMCHLWQQHHGTPPRKSYHNKEWSLKMESIGLMPSHDGEVGGNKTGQNMTHYIAKNGNYDKASNEFLKNNKLEWQSVPAPPKEKKAKSKIKYTCVECESNVWGKSGLFIVCGDCKEKMIENL